MLYLKIALLQ